MEGHRERNIRNTPLRGDCGYNCHPDFNRKMDMVSVMNVQLIAHTEYPEAVCNCAAETCVSEDIPDLEMSTNRFRSLKGAMASGHESVLEHATFTFAIEGISRACSHQLVRHRMASFSQQSQRYVKMDGFDYVVPESIKNSETIWKNEYVCDEISTLEWYEKLMSELSEQYSQLVKVGIPEEDARYILPNACTTNIIVTMNGRELMHFFGLRCCTRAQWEIRELAKEMLKQVREVAPVMFEKAGPQCKKLGYCPEAKGCGRYPPKVEALGLDMCVLSEVDE